MPKTIWKYELTTNPSQVIEMPAGAKILSIQSQHGKGCIWAEVITEREHEERYFKVHLTGHELPRIHKLGTYRGTFQLGDFVFHVYETMRK